MVVADAVAVTAGTAAAQFFTGSVAFAVGFDPVSICVVDEFWLSGIFQAVFDGWQQVDSLAVGFFVLAVPDAFAAVVCNSGATAVMEHVSVFEVWSVVCCVHGFAVVELSVAGAVLVAGGVAERQAEAVVNFRDVAGNR